MGGMVATANFPPTNLKAYDDGFEARLRVWESKARFAHKPKCDDTLKEKIMHGAFNQEILWWVLGLQRTLKDDVNPGTDLLPRPACMQEAESVVKPADDPKQTLIHFLTQCKAVERQDGAKYEELRDAAAQRLNVSRAEVGSLLTQVGVTRKYNKSYNAAVWQRPAWDKKGAAPALLLPLHVPVP